MNRAGEEVPAVQVIDLEKKYSSFTRRRRRANTPRAFLNAVIGRRDKSIVALDGVSFSVQPREVFGILGPNGSGKTTMIKILSTLVLPDKGSALVEGIDVVKNPYTSARHLQTVLTETTGLEKRITARQNLELFATLYGLPKEEAKQRIDELLNFFGLQDRADTMSQKFSTGMSRKLSVCRVLLSRASVIVFDEPTNGLDPIAASEFRHLLTKVLVAERAKTIILATHNLWEAEQICDRIALLRKGRLLAIGSPNDIRTRVADRVELSIRVGSSTGDSGGLIDGLKKVAGIQHADASMEEDGSQLKISIEGTKDFDYSEVFSLLKSRGLRIMGLEASQPSLEDAFLKLTKEAPV